MFLSGTRICAPTRLYVIFDKAISLSRSRVCQPKHCVNIAQSIRGKKDDGSFSQLFVPVPVKPNPDDINVGAELTGEINKADLLKILNKFYQKKEIKLLAKENGLDSKLTHGEVFILSNNNVL